jgi:hypothetical protein
MSESISLLSVVFMLGAILRPALHRATLELVSSVASRRFQSFFEAEKDESPKVVDAPISPDFAVPSGAVFTAMFRHHFPYGGSRLDLTPVRGKPRPSGRGRIARTA